MKRETPITRSPIKRTRKITGPKQSERTGLLVRADWKCERCYGTLTGPHGMSIHHRTPRGMGGSRSPDINGPANLLVLCGSGVTGCHGWVESYRDTAREQGYLVPRGQDGSTTPFMDTLKKWWLIDTGGNKTTTPRLGYDVYEATPPVVTESSDREDET